MRAERAWAGSVELLMQDQDRGQATFDLGDERTEARIPAGPDDAAGTDVASRIVERFDLVIMNPPYT